MLQGKKFKTVVYEEVSNIYSKYVDSNYLSLTLHSYFSVPPFDQFYYLDEKSCFIFTKIQRKNNERKKINMQILGSTVHENILFLEENKD